MEVCGGHTSVIVKSGIRNAMPANIRLVSGPGCPICVCTQYEIDCMIELANSGIAVATYGDMMRVPGSRGSLEQAKAKTGRVFEVYSTTEVLDLALHHNLVFFGVGFETTAPMSAFLLDHGISVFSAHRLIPPAMQQLKDSVSGFLVPGHVAAVIGTKPFMDVGRPQAVTGFTPSLVQKGIIEVLRLVKEGENGLVNAYTEAVPADGNKIAWDKVLHSFRVADTEWRGLGIIPNSGLEVRDESLDAKIKYQEILSKVHVKESKCMCGDVLKGMEPQECPLFGKVCTPSTPQGACMVSSEGACQIVYSK